MNEFSVDLSTRSTGCSYFENEELVDFTLISNEKDKDEALLISNVKRIISWMASKNEPSLIKIEGLSFGSKSGSKDLIAGQFWYLRCELRRMFPNVEIRIIPVTSWRSPLFTKEERVIHQEAKERFKKMKAPAKGLKGEQRKKVMALNKEMELACSIKEATWNKLDEKTQEWVSFYISDNKFDKDSKYDICDSIFLGQFKGTGKKVPKIPKIKKVPNK